MNLHTFRRTIRGIQRGFREARVFAKAMRSLRHPVQVHIIPIRRCNLSCAYCNEYDSHSQPVPAPVMLRRIDLLAALGTTIVTISGGEPLLHPALDEIIRRIRQHGIIATLITNGYLLTPERIRRLNRAGLEHLEISIDNVVPDAVSKKSLRTLDQKLRWLAAQAEFHVNINTVIGTGVPNPADPLLIARRALELGFTNTVGIVHDRNGQLIPLRQEEQAVYKALVGIKKRSYARFSHFQEKLVRGLPNDWHCPAGGRYLYVCEDGLVHWCSQQRGHPGIPLERYTPEHLERERSTVKPCAPYCTISCVHQIAMLDYLREKPQEVLPRFLPAAHPAARLLGWLFLKPAARRLLTRTATRILRVR